MRFVTAITMSLPCSHAPRLGRPIVPTRPTAYHDAHVIRTRPRPPGLTVHSLPNQIEQPQQGQQGPGTPNNSTASGKVPKGPADLFREIAEGTLLARCTAVPRVPWGPTQLIQVLASGLLLLLAATLIPSLGTSSLVADTLASLHLDELPAGQQAAVLHLVREVCLLASAGAVLAFALGPSKPRSAGLFRYDLPAPWVAVTLAACAVAFPLADPLITQSWTAVLKGVAGPDAVLSSAGGVLSAQVKACVGEGDWSSLGLHWLASGVLGPLWEETFWRGFFLTSLTRVLPPKACVASSSMGFALLHLTPSIFPAIWLLAATSDVLYLRSGTLGAPLLLHVCWNTSQLLAVAFLGDHVWV